MNLPRAVRYKQENVILVGLIPGPKEPDHDINSFLNPMVEELMKFWSGRRLICGDQQQTKIFKCALLCVACDIPAGRKVCGFMGHNAHYGCSRCFKWFPGDFGNVDFSGFDRENWPKRNGRVHRRVAMGMRTFSTPAEREREESQAGLRYSSLIQLPYFDAPRMLVVDPMHNLFLGSAKRIMQKIWVERSIINSHHFNSVSTTFLFPPGLVEYHSRFKLGFQHFLQISGRTGHCIIQQWFCLMY